MKRILLVFGGRTKSGKTTLAERFCGEHTLQKATFSDVVRRVASQKHPGVEQTLRLLQDVGARLVKDDPSGFCRDTCKNIEFSRQRCAVLDGLRHKSLLAHLKALHPHLTVVVIYVEASDATRLRRFDPTITTETLREIDEHPVEAEEHTLRQDADLILNTDRNEADSYNELSRWLAKNRLFVRNNEHSDRLKWAALFFRSWAVVSVAWILFVISFGYSDATKSWSILRASRQSTRERFVNANLLPLECKGLRGAESVDYLRFQGHCWMPIAACRKFYPAISNVSDSVLISDAYQLAAIKLPYENATGAAWRLVRAFLLVPLSLLGIAFAFLWAFRGTMIRRDLAEFRRVFISGGSAFSNNEFSERS